MTARRLLLVALFLFGFGEAPFGSSSESASAREALQAERAVALAPCGPAPEDRLVLVASDRHEAPAKGLNGGEEIRFAAAHAFGDRARRPANGAARPVAAPDGAAEFGFEARAPPFFA